MLHDSTIAELTIAPVSDAEIIRSVAGHPKIWPYISDDFCGKPEDFKPDKDDLYLGAFAGETCVGIFAYHAHSQVLAEVHSCVLPEWRGEPAIQAARDSLAFVFDKTPVKKVITHVPVYNRAALRFAERVGMVKEGFNRASFMKNGVLQDQTVLGILEGELCR